MDYSIFNYLNSAKTLSSADKANLFTERMSSTAHQREVADLKAAGLNPILSANNGASTGSAAQDDSDSSGSSETGTANAVYNIVKAVNKNSNTNAKSLSDATKAVTKLAETSTDQSSEIVKLSKELQDLITPAENKPFTAKKATNWKTLPFTTLYNIVGGALGTDPMEWVSNSASNAFKKLTMTKEQKAALAKNAQDIDQYVYNNNKNYKDVVDKTSKGTPNKARQKAYETFDKIIAEKTGQSTSSAKNKSENKVSKALKSFFTGVSNALKKGSGGNSR